MRHEVEASLFELWPQREMAGAVLAYAAGFAASHYAYNAYETVIGLLLAMSLGAAAFVLCLVALGGIGTRDRKRLSAAFASVTARVRRPKAAL
jgi:hypothetical protein